MQLNPIGWVEIPVSDIERAEKFYTDYFGFQMSRQPDQQDGNVQMSWFPMTMDSYGAAGMLIKSPGHIPSHEGPLVYFTSPGEGLGAGVAKAKEQGIKILMEKMDIGEHGFFALLEDSEGNRIAIHSMQE